MPKEKKKYSEKRPSWDEYFMEMAKIVATRATCDRLHVGAVIVRDRIVLSTGYNGAPRGLDHCDDSGHELSDGHCVRTVHGEANAIAQAAKSGTSIDSATLYTTASPCYDCFKLLINAGIKKVICGSFYSGRYGMSKNVLRLAKGAGVEIGFVNDDKNKKNK